MDEKLLRQAFGKFPTGVTVITWFDGDEKNGITVNSFTSVSLEPPLALISIDKKAKSYERLKNRSFSINILSDEQENIAWQFAGRPQSDLLIDWIEEGNSPHIKNAAAYFKCEAWKEVDAGDHVLFLGKITQFESSNRDSLTFYEGKMGSTKQYKNIEV